MMMIILGAIGFLAVMAYAICLALAGTLAIVKLFSPSSCSVENTLTEETDSFWLGILSPFHVPSEARFSDLESLRSFTLFLIWIMVYIATLLPLIAIWAAIILATVVGDSILPEIVEEDSPAYVDGATR